MMVTLDGALWLAQPSDDGDGFVIYNESGYRHITRKEAEAMADAERRKLKTITITLHGRDDLDGPNCGLPEALAELAPWAGELLNKVPPEYRDRVKFEVSHESDHDSCWTAARVYYERLETEGERDARVAEEDALNRRRDEEELARHRRNVEALEARLKAMG